MTARRKPFHEEDYRIENSSVCPILDVFVGKTEKKVPAYADTGCTSGISLFKDRIKDLEIGEKINEDPVRVLMADGHLIGANIYKSTAKIGDEKRNVLITVVDPTKVIGSVPIEEMTPLLGRNFLDNFDVLFEGKREPKRICLFK